MPHCLIAESRHSVAMTLENVPVYFSDFGPAGSLGPEIGPVRLQSRAPV